MSQVGRASGGLAGAMCLAAGILVRRAPLGGAAVAGGLLAAGIQLGNRWERGLLPLPHWEERLALIDRSHANRFSLAPLQTDSIGPLTTSLLRNGFLPLLMNSWSAAQLRRASVFSITAPARAFSTAELREVDEFVRRGGLLLVNCGWEEKGPAGKALLAKFGFDIPRVPLGPYPVQRVENHLPGDAQCINAWPVVVTEPTLKTAFAEASAAYRPPILDQAQSQKLAQLLSPLTGTAPLGMTPPPTAIATNEVRVLFQTTDGYPVVVARRIGEGSVVVVGDTYFFGNDNLENLQYYRKGNLLFLKHLFETTAWRRK